MSQGISTSNLPRSSDVVELLGHDYVGSRRRTIRITLADLIAILSTAIGGGGAGGGSGSQANGEIIEAIQALQQGKASIESYLALEAVVGKNNTELRDLFAFLRVQVDEADALSLAPRDRPGDARYFFTQSMAGAARDLPAIAIGSVVATERGAVLRVPSIRSPTNIALRRDCAIEPGQVYAARFAVRRVEDTSDPLGDAVECRIAWLDKEKGFLASTVVDGRSLTVADGRRYIAARISKDQTADIAAPSAAVYWRPYLRLLGGDGVTDVEVLDAVRADGLPGPQGGSGPPPTYQISADNFMVRWQQPNGGFGSWLDLGTASKAQADRAAAAATQAAVYAQAVGAAKFDFAQDSDPNAGGYDWSVQ